MGLLRRVLALGIALCCVVAVQSVSALSLEEAKTRGLVGEKANGYLGVVELGNKEAQALAKDINEKRRRAYEEIARRNGANIQAVETLAGEKAVQNTKTGYLVEGSGGWVKKQ